MSRRSRSGSRRASTEPASGTLEETRRSRADHFAADSPNAPMRKRSRGTTVAPIALLIALPFAAPLVLGALGTLAPAFGFVPVLAPPDAAGAGPWAGFTSILADPRFVQAVLLTLKTGVLATALVLALVTLTLVSVHGTRLWRWITASLPPLLAVPHAAFAVGLAFLVAPSGWLVRLVSPWPSGWARPPTDWVVPDAGGWSLIAVLLMKEAPFLLLAAAAQLRILDVEAALRIGRTLGYSPARCWSRLILPRLWPRVRLTLVIVLVFNLSVVDLAILLGPGNPPTLPVLLVTLVNDPGSRAAASAGAVLLALLVIAVIGLGLALERLIVRIASVRRGSGARGLGLGAGRRLGQGIVLCLSLASIAALSVLPLWSLAARWRFPEPLPSAWTLRHWAGRGEMLIEPALETLALALVSSALALGAAIAWLELERHGRAPRIDWLWYVPLLVPQVSLLFGWQAAALLIGADGAWSTVLHAHWLYALPYVILILAVAWREHEPRWGQAAAVLGAGYWRVLWRIRLPLLARPLCQAAAVAVAVSVAQYLPTLLLGAGRHQTLAIELVTSVGGVDRRIIAVLAVLQSLLPLLAFVLALLYPVWRQRRLGKQTGRPVRAAAGGRG